MSDQLNQLWQQAQLTLPESVFAMADHYLNIKVSDFILPCPYWRDKLNQSTGEKVRGFLGGKGTAIEIQTEVNRIMTENQHESDQISIKSFLKQKKIGVDCSGLTYNLANAWQMSLDGKSLDDFITHSPGGNPTNPKRFRTSADSLTGQWNSTLIRKIEDVRAGDLIRMQQGKHVLIILYRSINQILYIHSKEKLYGDCVHLSYIDLPPDISSLLNADWHEFTKENKQISSEYFNPDRGDGVTRFHWWS